MHSHGEMLYCPKCGKEVYPASEPCKGCGYDGYEPPNMVLITFIPNKPLAMILGSHPAATKKILTKMTGAEEIIWDDRVCSLKNPKWDVVDIKKNLGSNVIKRTFKDGSGSIMGITVGLF